MQLSSTNRRHVIVERSAAPPGSLFLRKRNKVLGDVWDSGLILFFEFVLMGDERLAAYAFLLLLALKLKKLSCS